MKITNLLSKATKLVCYSIKIKFKVLANYFCNWAKFFLDNMRIKEPKIIYNNHKVVSEI